MPAFPEPRLGRVAHRIISNRVLVTRNSLGLFQWLIAALAGPTVLLLAVKLFSVILSKGFGLREVIVSLVGIAATITLFYLVALFHKTQDNRTENTEYRIPNNEL